MKEPKFKITATSGRFDPKSVPSYVWENIAQVLYNSVLRDWNNPEIREDYERWKAERDAKSTAE